MSSLTALILLAIFGAVVWAILALAPSESDLTPLIDQVSQRIGAVVPIG